MTMVRRGTLALAVVLTVVQTSSRYLLVQLENENGSGIPRWGLNNGKFDTHEYSNFSFVIIGIISA